MRLHLFALVGGACCLVCAASAHARVESPRVVPAGAPDPVSLTAWATDPVWQDVPASALARRWFEELTDAATGVRLVEPGPWEGTDKVAEFGLVADPWKVRHVYGYADRRVLAGVLAALWQASGRGRSRVVELAEAGHFLAELEIDGRWQAFDPALRATFARSATESAAWDEIRRQPELWQKPRGPRFFPWDDPAPLQAAWSAATVKPRYFPAPSGHSLEFALRRGEAFTRFWTPQGDRWKTVDADGKDAARRAQLDLAPRGPKPHGPAAGPLHANGVFVYAPQLVGDAADFRDGAADSANVTVTEAGLTLAQPGEGFAVFAVGSPYVIVPEVGKLEDAKDDRDAAVVEIDAADATLAVSRDAGVTWITVETKSFPARLDLTPQVAGGYGYWLRIDLKGQPGKALVKSLKLTTWVQLAPGALSGVQPGVNRLQFKTGDQYGLPSQPVVIATSTADENSFLRPVIRPPREFHPGESARRVQGPFTVRLAPPPQTRIAWCELGACFAVAAGAPPPTIATALGAPQAFQPLELPALPADHQHTHAHWDRALRFDAPQTAVYAQFAGGAGLDQLRLTAHCVRTETAPASRVQVRHAWTEGGESREFQTELSGGDGYEFTAGAAPVTQSLELRVPGSR